MSHAALIAILIQDLGIPALIRILESANEDPNINLLTLDELAQLVRDIEDVDVDAEIQKGIDSAGR